MKKIIIIGLTASGKTTLANKLGKILNIPVFHLDTLFWKADWQMVTQSEFIEKQEKLIEQNAEWIMDGSFPRSKSLDLRLTHADTIIFFDIPKIITFWRMMKRYVSLFGKERPDVGSGNKQKWPFTWHNIKYAWQYPTKEIYSKIMTFKNTKQVFVIKNNKDIKNLLKSINK